jgi:hypothetical protein
VLLPVASNSNLTADWGDTIIGVVVFEDTLLLDTLVSSNGCDSVVQLTITVVPPDNVTNLSSQESNMAYCYPNPFTAELNIDLFLGLNDYVQITIHDMLGARVAAIHTGQLRRGKHTFGWNGTTESGGYVPQGLYICRIQFAGALGFQQMIFRN